VFIVMSLSFEWREYSFESCKLVSSPTSREDHAWSMVHHKKNWKFVRLEDAQAPKRWCFDDEEWNEDVVKESRMFKLFM